MAHWHRKETVRERPCSMVSAWRPMGLRQAIDAGRCCRPACRRGRHAVEHRQEQVVERRFFGEAQWRPGWIVPPPEPASRIGRLSWLWALPSPSPLP